MASSSKSKAQRRAPGDPVYLIRVSPAKPNPMFTEKQTAQVRFLKYSAPMPCRECGRRKIHHWTMICTFAANSMGVFTITNSGVVHLPLSPVCRGHLLIEAPLPKLERRRTPKP